MNDLLNQLEAAMNAEKKTTPALTVARDVLGQLKKRLQEHSAAVATPEVPVNPPAE